MNEEHKKRLREALEKQKRSFSPTIEEGGIGNGILDRIAFRKKM